MFGKLMSLSRDDRIGDYARLCTELPAADVARLGDAGAAGGPGAAAAKRELARAVVAIYYGDSAAAESEAAFDTVFRRHEAPVDLAELVLGSEDPVHLPALLQDLGWAASRGAARKLVQGGGVKLDGVPVTELDLGLASLDGRVLTSGRRNQRKIIVQ